ncbi:hypothetical protein Micbo1qcDRAFT_32248 [Microdochium bolleyi]|uniref:F-box domain-containing protein n=1 Tax=Microdochium bolleyi TaxID=196109 RepID=A0A136IQX0_9PEZI|nr:hypothetical protein Micbo1qcDRAFT_32248 [Microdochium bolleyi]
MTASQTETPLMPQAKVGRRPGTTGPFAKLPVELVRHIGELAVSEFARYAVTDYALLCRVSRYFAYCFTPNLYESINLGALRGSAVAKLLHTMSSAPMLSEHIRTIRVPSDYKLGTIVPTSSLLSMTSEAVRRIHGRDFLAELSTQLQDDSGPGMNRSLDRNPNTWLGIMITMAPNLQHLSWSLEHHHRAVETALHIPGPDDKMIISRLRTLAYEGDHANSPGRNYELLTPKLKLCCASIKHLSLERVHLLPQDCTYNAMPSQLVSCHFRHSAIGREVLTNLLKKNPHLEDLQLGRHHFGWGASQPFVSRAEAGDILRAQGKALTNIWISCCRYVDGAAPPAGEDDFVGSLRPLTRLRALAINPDDVTDARDDSRALQHSLPPSLEELHLGPRTRRASRPVFRQLRQLTGSRAFARLRSVRVELQVHGVDGGSVAIHDIARHNLARRQRGWDRPLFHTQRIELALTRNFRPWQASEVLDNLVWAGSSIFDLL